MFTEKTGWKKLKDRERQRNTEKDKKRNDPKNEPIS
jgi:hypothetical protein